MRDWWNDLGIILQETVIEWLEDGIPGRGAALSYYVLLSLGPLSLILVGALEFFLGAEEARSGVVSLLRDHVGPRAADTVETVLARVEVPDLLTPEAVVTVALLLFGATAAFANVRGSLNTIWGVSPQDESLWEIVKGFLHTRVRGFLMIALTGMVLALSFTVSSVVGVLGRVVEARLSQGWLLVQGMDAALSVLVTGALFGAIYRTLPAVRIAWRTIWVGAFATALIFVIGKALVASLIASASWTSYYGPGASVVAFLAWIYFSAQLFYLGAEFTQVWSRHKGGVMNTGEEAAAGDAG